jgi:hypothetical protein
MWLIGKYIGKQILKSLFVFFLQFAVHCNYDRGVSVFIGYEIQFQLTTGFMNCIWLDEGCHTTAGKP